MSKHAPGSKDWWLETAVIAFCSLVVAIWLWDGPLWEPAPGGPVNAEITERVNTREPTHNLERLVNQGCLTAEHLRRMREGEEVLVLCPPPDDFPQTPRPFP